MNDQEIALGFNPEDLEFDSAIIEADPTQSFTETIARIQYFWRDGVDHVQSVGSPDSVPASGLGESDFHTRDYAPQKSLSIMRHKNCGRTNGYNCLIAAASTGSMSWPSTAKRRSACIFGVQNRRM